MTTERLPVGRVRIRTHQHMEKVHGDGVVAFSTLLPSMPDVFITYVRPDGTEEEIAGVVSVTWKVACNNEPAKAIIEVVGAELQADASGFVQMVPLEQGEMPKHVAEAVERAER